MAHCNVAVEAHRGNEERGDYTSHRPAYVVYFTERCAKPKSLPGPANASRTRTPRSQPRYPKPDQSVALIWHVFDSLAFHFGISLHVMCREWEHVITYVRAPEYSRRIP